MKYVNHIRVWKFKDAPGELRELSENGGDEDWLALIPPIIERYPMWMDNPSFGCCSVDAYDHPELPGYRVVIGSHA